MAVQNMTVTSTTRTRDKLSLFDYESAGTKTEVHEVDVNGVLEGSWTTCARERNGDSVFMLPVGSVAMRESRKADHLCRFRNEAGHLVVGVAKGSRAKAPWLVVRDLAQPLCRLAVGDVIKLGRFEFRVKALVATGGDDVPKLPSGGSRTAVPFVEPSEAPSKVCRICLMEGEEGPDADPLIAPCACKGSIEHVHVGCLQHWLRSKVSASAGNGNSFRYATPQCELCKTCLPADVGDASDRRPLVELPRTEPPFLVLESHNHGDVQQMTHVVSLASEKVLRIGRSQDSHVRIDDVSVSRTHSTIAFENGEFVIADNNAKFGTLLALRQDQRVAPGSTLSIQSGRTVLKFSMPEDDTASIGGSA